MVEFEVKEMVELLLVIFLTVGVVVLAVNAFGGLEGIRKAFCSKYPEWCGEGPTPGSEEFRVKNSGEALKDAAEWVVTKDNEGDIPDDKWEKICEERGWVYCLKTECEEVKREITGKDKVCCAKDKCKSPLLPPVGGAISFADNDNDDAGTILSQIGKEAWVSCGDYAQIKYDEDAVTGKTKDVWYMYNLDAGWIWRSDLDGYENYRAVSDPVGEEFFGKVDDIHRTIIQGLKGKRYDILGLSGIKVIQDAVKSTNDDRLILHLANGNEVKISHGDEEKLSKLADLADYGFADSCTVYNFQLPQNVESSSSYITLMGDPKYMIYYEKFPEKVEGAWSYTSKDIILATAAVGGFLNMGMGGLKLTGATGKQAVLVLIRKKTIKEAGEAIMSKAVREFGGLKTLTTFAIKKLLLGRWIRQETTDAVENVVKTGFKRILKKETYMQGLKNADVLADELYYVVKPMGTRFSKDTLPDITESHIRIAITNLKNRGIDISMDDTSRAALAGRLKSIRNDLIDGNLNLIPAEREIMEKAVFGGEIKEGFLKRTYQGVKERLKKLFKKSDEMINIKEGLDSATQEAIDETVEQVAKDEFVMLNDLVLVPKSFRDRYLKEAEEAMMEMSPGIRTKLMQKADNLISGLKGAIGLPPEGFPSKGRTVLMTTILAGGYVALLVDSKTSKYNEPCGQNSLCIFTPKGFRLENIEEVGQLSSSLRDYWWAVKTPKIIGNEWSTRFYIASPCHADLLVTKDKCKCDEYSGYDEVIVKIKQKVCCDTNNDKINFYSGVYSTPTEICTNNLIPTDLESMWERLNPSCTVVCETGAKYNNDLMRCEIEATSPGNCPTGYMWDSEADICWVREDENLVKATEEFEPYWTWIWPEMGQKEKRKLAEEETIRLSPGDWESELLKILEEKNKDFKRETSESEYKSNGYDDNMYWVLSEVLNQANGVTFKECTSGSKVEVDCIKVEVKNQDRYSDITNPNFCIDNKAAGVDYLRTGIIGVEIAGSIIITAFTGGWAAPVSLYVIGSGSVLTDAFLNRKGMWPNNQGLN